MKFSIKDFFSKREQIRRKFLHGLIFADFVIFGKFTKICFHEIYLTILSAKINPRGIIVEVFYSKVSV